MSKEPDPIGTLPAAQSQEGSDSTHDLPEWIIECLSRIFSALSDPTRLRILHALAHADDLCVTDLAERAGLSISAVSHQLRLLRDRRLIDSRRDGRMVYYSLADYHIRDLMETGIQHACEDCQDRY
jgi:ArsR family transcriptional regulator, lead/cadmium/zinc/bismuth-responsive transcriptional repressor